MEIIKMDEKYVEDFLNLRLSLFRELGEIHASTDISELREVTKNYYLLHINRDLISFGVTEKGNVVSTGAVCLFDRIPYIENLRGREGYVLNIYTTPEYRGKGYAGRLTEKIIEYARKNKIKRLWLNSSNAGRGVYEKYGFIEKDNEMELFL